MPEGDALHRAARDLQVLVGEKLEVETPHPRARVSGVAERLDGRKLVKVEAVGKNLLLRFEDGLVLRSHLRMKGRWQVLSRNGHGARRGMPWLVLRGARDRGRPLARPGARARREPRPQPGAGHPRRPARHRRDGEQFRAADQRTAIGEALLDQRLVAGIGNLWRAEALWRAQISPWRTLGDVSDEELRTVLDAGVAADAPLARLGAQAARRLPAGRPAVPALRHADQVARPGRREPDRLLVPRVPERRRAGRDVTRSVRAPHLHSALRGFCLGSFAFFGREIEEGAEIQFVFEEHGSRDRPTLYEYRPLVRAVRRGARRTAARARRHRDRARGAGPRACRGDLRPRSRRCSRRARPLPHRPAAAARGRGRVLRRVRLGRRRLRPGLCEPRAVAVRRGAGLRGDRAARRDRGGRDRRARRRVCACGMRPTASSPRTGRTRPGSYPRASAARPTACACSSSSGLCPRREASRPMRRARSPTRSPRFASRPAARSRPGRFSSSGSTGGPSACGPCYRSPRRSRRASRPGSTSFAARSRVRCWPSSGRPSDDRELGDALDRWELSLFQTAPFRAEQLRAALEALLGAGDGAWAASLRAAVLLGETGRERSEPPSTCCARLRDGVGGRTRQASSSAERSSRRSRAATGRARRRARRVAARRAAEADEQRAAGARELKFRAKT